MRQGIVGIAGIDTRAVVRHLRTLRFDEGRRVLRRCAGRPRTNCWSGSASQPSMLGADLAGEVSTDAAYIVEPEGRNGFTVAAIDLGIKTNTPRNFADRGIRSHVLPSTATLRPDRRPRSPTGSSCPTAPATPPPPTTSSGSPVRSSARGSRCSVSASAIRSSAGRWAGRPTRWCSGTAASTSRSSTTPPDGSRSPPRTTASRSRAKPARSSTPRSDRDRQPYLRQRRRRRGHQTR